MVPCEDQQDRRVETYTPDTDNLLRIGPSDLIAYGSHTLLHEGNMETILSDSFTLNKSYAEIRALVPSDGDVVWLNDWGGGRFVFDASDRSADVTADEMTTK